MEDLAPPPAFDLSELSVTEVDIAAEIAKEMQNRSRSTGHDADSTEIDAMIQRSRDLIAMFEKQVSKDEAAQLPPKQPGSASGALTKEIGTDQEPMLNVDTVSVGAADTEISDVQTVIKMSALPASSAESRTTTQPSSASSTPQTSQTPISGDKKTSSKSNSRLPILTDADVFAAQNQFPPTSCLQNAVLTAELVSRSSEAALEEIHSAGSRTKIKIPTPNLPLQALPQQDALPKQPSPAGRLPAPGFLAAPTAAGDSHPTVFSAEPNISASIASSLTSSTRLSLNSSLRTIPVGASSLPPVVANLPGQTNVPAHVEEHILEPPPMFNDDSSDALPGALSDSVHSDSLAPMKMEAPPPKPTAMMGIQPSLHSIPSTDHLNYDVEDEEALVKVIRISGGLTEQSGQSARLAGSLGTSSRLRLESMVLAPSAKHSLPPPSQTSSAAERETRTLTLEEKIDAQIANLERSRQNVVLTREDLASNIITGRSPPRSTHGIDPHQGYDHSSSANNALVTEGATGSFTKTINETIEQLIKSSSKPECTPTRPLSTSSMALGMPQSTSVPTVQLTRSSLHSRSQGKLEQMDAGTPLIDSAINAVHSAMSPSSNKKLNRPEERMKDKEQPTTRFFSAKELATIQKLPQLMPSDQIRFMRVLQQISGNHTPQASSASRSGATGIHASSEYPPELTFEFVEGTGDLVVKVVQLLKQSNRKVYLPGTVFEGLVEDSYRIMIPAYLIPPRLSLTNRYSAKLLEWRQSKKIADEKVHSNKVASYTKSLLPSQKSLNWLVSFVDNVFRARHVYLEREAEKCLDNNLDVFEPQNFSDFIDSYIKGRLGNVHRASVLRVELEDAIRRYYFVSAHARLLHLFWETIHEDTDRTNGYEEQDPSPISPSSVLDTDLNTLDTMPRVSLRACNKNFSGGQVRESMIPQRKLNYTNQCSAFLLNLRQACSTICVDRRIVIPEHLRKRAETQLIQKGFGKEVFATAGVTKRHTASASQHAHGGMKIGGATFDPMNPLGLPKYYDAKVIQFPTHKAFFSNAIFNLLGDYEGLTTRIVKKLEKADIWTPGKSNPARVSCDIIEGEIYTVLEAALNIFEHMLVSINGSEEALRADDHEAGSPSPEFPPVPAGFSGSGSQSGSRSNSHPSRSDSNSLYQQIVEPSRMVIPGFGFPPSARGQPKIIPEDPASDDEIREAILELQNANYEVKAVDGVADAVNHGDSNATSQAVYDILAEFAGAEVGVDAGHELVEGVPDGEDQSAESFPIDQMF
ncbi:hypothetical protein GL50803_0016793 [Giardia duodenalis]|uniref:Uncharacterized protein n=1 Tax=Giardia intestinalis (strain ATCC 50803 / WB clone C6) TaxID=184922 RepID=A8BUD0_GIAIC|nr:hypothetical protein GL50803_0016793 [Giardia intestinalis]KAE8305493.1 hypothetical protein GL50803_0016793 [Giardia intestinalis]|eukprot:XP_001704758.1 Hypothetical protein GL50803_16793 [Giardia lamblia ATCC 50803]